MADFGEALWKMDKWASEDSEDMQAFYNIIDDETLTTEEKISEIEDFLEILIWDYERLDSYIEEPWTEKELAKELVERNL